MKTTLKIAGMHCASCSTLVEKGLKKKDGIKQCSVSLASNAAYVTYDENKISLNDINKEVSKMGYKVVDSIDQNVEAKKYLIKFIIAAILTIPAATTMFVKPAIWLGSNVFLFDMLVWLFATIIVFVAGRGFHVGFIKKLRRGESNMDTLISIGTLVAWLYGTYALVQTYRGGEMMHFYHFFEGASFIITFILLGKYLEVKSKGQASKAIQKLLQLQAKQALVLKDGKEVLTDVDDINVGDVVVVKSGDKVAVDGEIVKGASHIDESMLTGESIPVHKKESDEVFSGTIVQNGTLHIKVTKEQTETMLAKIIEVVNQAQSSKPPIQHMVDKVVGIFVPSILVIAILSFIAWYVHTGGDLQTSILTMVSVIVIACPCAMGLATPMAIMVGTGQGAKKGVLIKGGEILEKSKKIDIVVFDKTGTLTQGKPSVTDVEIVGGKESDILDYLLTLSKNSHHPLSGASVDYAVEKGGKELRLDSFMEHSGMGLHGKFAAKDILFGNKKLMAEFTVDIELHKDQVATLQAQGKTVNYLAVENKLVALVALLDAPKENSLTGIKKLEKMNIDAVMISGDTEKTVAAIATQLGIKRYYAEVMPEQKASIVRKLQEEGNIVAFVGDGINDAPALAQSDLAIGMGTGTDVAIETAEIVLVHGDPMKVADAIKLARRVYSIIKQNLFWAFAYNTLLVPIAALGLLLPTFAGLAMSLSSVSVVFNSLRLKLS